MSFPSRVHRKHEAFIYKGIFRIILFNISFPGESASSQFYEKIIQSGMPFVKQIYNKIYLRRLTYFDTVVCYFFFNLLLCLYFIFLLFFFLITLDFSLKSIFFIGINSGDPGC